MRVDGLSEVPSPPALSDIYDELEAGDTPRRPAPSGLWAAAIISFLLSSYGFWVGFASLKAWLSPGPFCSDECRTGIAYGMLLFLPACFGVVLGVALIRRKAWARPAAFAVFGAFALENLVRVDLSLQLSYRTLFLLMFLANCLGLVALLLEPRVRRAVDSGAVVLPSGREIDGESFDFSLQSAAGRPARKAGLALCSVLASTVLIATMAWYRIPDSLLRRDFLGVFAFDRPPVPRWIAASPAVSGLVLWGFALATGIVLRRRWARTAAVITSAVIGTICVVYLPMAPNLWARIEVAGLVTGNGLLAGLLLTSRCRAEFHD